MTAKTKTPAATPPSRPNGPPRVTSGELLQSAGRLIIEHAGTEYLLSRTRQGKLILTK
jgi:hemin uptake protein HemP